MSMQPGGPDGMQGQVLGPPVPGGSPGPAAQPKQEWRYVPAPVRRNTRMALAVALVGLLAAAALVVGIVDLTRAPTSTTPAAASPTDTTAANRALCTAIAPLMSESDRVAKTWTSLGPPGSPQASAGVQAFIGGTKDWLARVQPVIDSHPDADPFFRRSLQDFVDSNKFVVLDLEAGPWQPYDQTVWNSALGSYNGPLSVCWGLGVRW